MVGQPESLTTTLESQNGINDYIAAKRRAVHYSAAVPFYKWKGVIAGVVQRITVASGF